LHFAPGGSMAALLLSAGQAKKRLALPIPAS